MSNKHLWNEYKYSSSFKALNDDFRNLMEDFKQLQEDSRTAFNQTPTKVNTTRFIRKLWIADSSGIIVLTDIDIEIPKKKSVKKKSIVQKIKGWFK